MQYKQISNQFCEKSEENLSFVLHRNEILRKMNCVYISHQEMIQNQFLKLYHDCFNENHWDKNKTLQLIQHYFIWNEIVNNICIYITMCSVCQNKAIHCHQFYSQLKSLFISKNTWNSLFKKINLDWITELFSSMKMKNNQKYNNILTVICCITKYTLFILIWNDITAADFVKLFFEHVEYYFDFSRSIIMNRNSHITSNFWWEVCEIQMIK